MMKLKNIVLVLSSAFAVATANAGGIPVIDGAAIAQDAANFVKQIAEMKTQIENQVKQLTELKNQVSAMTGGRDMGNLAREAIGSNIPDSWQDIYNSVGNLNTERLQGGFVQGEDAGGLLRMMSTVDQSFSDIKQRMARIEELTNKINTTTDIKASADLQSRITAEQTAISNQQVKLDQMYRMYQMEKELYEQKALMREECQMQAWGKGKTSQGCK